MVLAGAQGHTRLVQCFERIAVELSGGSDYGMMRPRTWRSGRSQYQQTGQLRGHLAQIFEAASRFENIGGGLVVYRSTNGLGVLPEISIHTLFVCRYSRIASMPLSRPMPDRL